MKENRNADLDKVPAKETIEDLISQIKNKENLIRLTIYPSVKKPRPAPALAVKPSNKLPTKLPKIDFPLPKLLTKSFLPLCTLFLLHQQPKYGNEILNWLKEKSVLWPASPGTIYPLLRQLESENLIKGHWEPGIKRPRYVYQITEKGASTYEKLRGTVLPQLEKSLRLLNQLIQETQNSQKYK